jgi:hypothetical protein
VVSTALWSGLFAALIAILVTVAIEYWGGRLGGILGTVPTTIVPATIGIFHRANGDDFVAAVATAPVGILLNAIFLLCWLVFPPRIPRWSANARLVAVLVASLAVWFFLAAAALSVLDTANHHGMPPLIFGIAATTMLVLLGVSAMRRVRQSPRGHRHVRPLVLLLRGLFAATTVTFAVWMANAGLPLISGIAAVFPAIFTTAMVSLWLSQGEHVPQGASGPMMLGSASIAIYCLIAIFTMPKLGTAAGVAVAWLSAVTVSTIPALLLFGGAQRHAQQ